MRNNSESRSTRRTARSSTRKERVSKDVATVRSENQLKDNAKAVNIQLTPKTSKQREFINSMENNEISVGIGPAGVGKTYCTAGVAAKKFVNGQITKIVLTRANVTIGNSVGMLKGDIYDKMQPLLQPILDSLGRHLGQNKVKYMIECGQIELLPFEYVRGRSFYDAMVIIDEAQNLTPEDMIAIVTRYESGRTVLLGDPFQNDLPSENGLDWIDAFMSRNDMQVPVVKFGVEDVVRSEFVKKFLRALYAELAAKKKKPVSRSVPLY